MTVRVYYSTDAGAPALPATTAGSLIAVLDACLVNGFGSKAAAGWSKPFSDTNIAVYRTPAGNQRYLRVQDTTTGAARVVGYESMSDANTGAGEFPTAAQLNGGAYISKGSSSSKWMVIASDRFVAMLIPTGDAALTSSNTSVGFAFGDFVSHKVGDAYNTILIASGASGTLPGIGEFSSSLTSAVTGHWIARSHTQIGTAITAGKSFDSVRSPIAYPDPVSGGILLSPIYVQESALGLVRGVLPGLWAHLHGMSNAAIATPMDTFSGSGELTGKTFQFANFSTTGSLQARLAVEISDTW